MVETLPVVQETRWPRGESVPPAEASFGRVCLAVADALSVRNPNRLQGDFTIVSFKLIGKGNTSSFLSCFEVTHFSFLLCQEK